MRVLVGFSRSRLISGFCRPPASCCVRQMSAHTWGSGPQSDDPSARRFAARKLLGVAVDATPKQLQEAYNREALRWHPDRHVGSGAEEAAAASLRFQAASDALSVLVQKPAVRTGGKKTWVYNEKENSWVWGVPNEGQQPMHQPGKIPYDGSQGFSPSQSYRPPWADVDQGRGVDGHHPRRKVHDGAWWDPSWDAGAHECDSHGGTFGSNATGGAKKRLWYLMLPVIAFLMLKNVIAVAFISAGPMLALAPDETIARARAQPAAARPPQ